MYLNNKKNTVVSPTLSVSAVVHFIFFSTVHIKDQKKQVSIIRKYHNHTLQTNTRPDSIMHFIIPFRTQIVCAKVCVRFSTFCPQCCRTCRARVCCVETTHYKWKVPSYLWVMWHKMLISVYAISVLVILSSTVTASQDINIRRLVTSPFKSMYFQFFWVFLQKNVANERKLINAIYNFIEAYWCLLFLYGRHFNTTTNLNGIFFGDVNFSVNRNRDILKCMFPLNGTYLRTKITIYFNISLYSASFYSTCIPVNLLKITPINIAMVIFTKNLEMHCLNCDGTKWRICMNTNINIWATSLMR